MYSLLNALCTHSALVLAAVAALWCRGLFATHYHRLADAHAQDPAVSIRHMACHVSSDQAGREQVEHQHNRMQHLHSLICPVSAARVVQQCCLHMAACTCLMGCLQL